MKLDIVFCRACDCAHEPGQHKRRGTAPPSSWDDGSVKAKPERAKPKFDPGNGKKSCAPASTLSASKTRVTKKTSGTGAPSRFSDAPTSSTEAGTSARAAKSRTATPSFLPKATPAKRRALKVSTTAPTSKRVETRPRGSRNDYQAGLMRIIRAAEREGITPAQWRAKHGDKPPALVRMPRNTSSARPSMGARISRDMGTGYTGAENNTYRRPPCSTR